MILLKLKSLIWMKNSIVTQIWMSWPALQCHRHPIIYESYEHQFWSAKRWWWLLYWVQKALWRIKSLIKLSYPKLWQYFRKNMDSDLHENGVSNFKLMHSTVWIPYCLNTLIIFYPFMSSLSEISPSIVFKNMYFSIRLMMIFSP